eukprot:SM000004S15103  [mRNA]  locus=s4:1185617:1187119:- [translate_table: standard]
MADGGGGGSGGGQGLAAMEWRTRCWGCGLGVGLPAYSPMFRCGWCGAVSVEGDDQQAASAAAAAGRAAARGARARWPRETAAQYRWSQLQGRLMLAAVTTFILCLIGGGVWSVFPVLFPAVSSGFLLHTVLTAALAFNTVFNFALCSCRPAGRLPPMCWGEGSAVGQGGLDNVTYCRMCHFPKPHRAHHCRSCGLCVLDMDHHCPFIANCVGATNQRHFVLFLIYAVISCTYLAGISTYTLRTHCTHELTTIRDASRSGSIRRGFLALTTVQLSWLFRANSGMAVSYRAMVLFYLCLAGAGTAIGMATLLRQQLRLLLRGITYIDSLQCTNGAAGQRGQGMSMTNLRHVFGTEWMPYWLLPRLGPPPGSEHPKWAGNDHSH